SSVPVIESARPGAHVNAVGAFTPETRELGTDLISRAQVYLDTRSGALSEAGDLLIPMHEGRFHPDRIVGEIGDIINGKSPGRPGLPDGAVTVYKSVGAAFLDAATARLILDRAEANGTGATFAFM
ncbi:MAG: ornithine cyclodeaminase family protein, partial [Chloroflexi bacterium]|nr:ornithine cyclodeaminase family protein [Chloroflexota bacterium]